MVRKYIMRLCMLLAVLLTAACSSDQLDTDTHHKDAYAIAFDFSVLDPQTRAIGLENGDNYDPLNENRIDNMHLFFYDGETQQDYFSTTRGNLVLTPGANSLQGSATAYLPKVTPNLRQGRTFAMYVVVNYPDGAASLSGMTLTQLKRHIHTTSTITDQRTTIDKQPNFLMDGTVSTGSINWVAGSNIYNVPTTVDLARAAAKIRLLIDKIDVKSKDETFSLVGDPSVSLINATAHTTLLAGTPAQGVPSSTLTRFATEYQPMVRKSYDSKEFWARAIPFYTYENDWSANGDIRTHLSVKLRLRGNTSGVEKDFYYSIPINYLVASTAMDAREQAGISKAQRNHLYDIRVNISQLGELDPGTPMELKAHISVEDWNETNLIDGAISKAHYLTVKELTPTMPNVSVRDIEYFSDLPLDQSILNDFTASFVGYDYIGDPHTIEGKKNDTRTFLGRTKKFFENITITPIEKNGRKYIRVTNPVPDNYVPWVIKFRAQQVRVAGETAHPLFKDITVTQYPPIYVTGEKSTGNKIYWYSSFSAYNPNGLDAEGNTRVGFQLNNTIYKVHVLVPREGDIVGDPTRGDAEGYTQRDAESNKLISPEFVIASQWGMSAPHKQYVAGGTALGWETVPVSPNPPGFTDRFDFQNSSYAGARSAHRYRNYWDAASRAHNYWEHTYGKSGTRTIQGDYGGYDMYGHGVQYGYFSHTETFENEGYWRLPTVAELALIVSIQSDARSAVKNLLWGYNYWPAREGYVYDFLNKTERYVGSQAEYATRPIFDTYNK